MTEDWHPRLVAHARLRRDARRDVEVLLLPERVVRLNATAAEILRLCDGRRTAACIGAALGRRYPDQDVTPAVSRFLDRVRLEGWVR